MGYNKVAEKTRGYNPPVARFSPAIQAQAEAKQGKKNKKSNNSQQFLPAVAERLLNTASRGGAHNQV